MRPGNVAGRLIALAVALALLGGCTTSEFLIETARAIQESEAGSADPTAHGAVLRPAADARVLQVQQGDAVWYGAGAHGNRTASGEIFDRHGMTAAHNSFPFESLVRVTNLRNGRQVIVRITDRGAFREPRIIDVSERAAEMLGFKSAGVTPVRLELLSTAGVASR